VAYGGVLGGVLIKMIVVEKGRCERRKKRGRFEGK
jgi:hypothetical protein